MTATRKCSNFHARYDIDHSAGAIAQNKSNCGILHITQTSNADNQTTTSKSLRTNTPTAITYIYAATSITYNVHSAAG